MITNMETDGTARGKALAAMVWKARLDLHWMGPDAAYGAALVLAEAPDADRTLQAAAGFRAEWRRLQREG